jgi:hypothetical protein
MGDLDHGFLALCWPPPPVFSTTIRNVTNVRDTAPPSKTEPRNLLAYVSNNGRVVLNAKLRLLLFCHR